MPKVMVIKGFSLCGNMKKPVHGYAGKQEAHEMKCHRSHEAMKADEAIKADESDAGLEANTQADDETDATQTGRWKKAMTVNGLPGSSTTFLVLVRSAPPPPPPPVNADHGQEIAKEYARHFIPPGARLYVDVKLHWRWIGDMARRENPGDPRSISKAWQKEGGISEAEALKFVLRTLWEWHCKDKPGSTCPHDIDSLF